MYIIFDDKGKVDLYYYVEPLPKEHKGKQYVKIEEKDIPEKEGHNSIPYLKDGKLEWKFEKIETNSDLEEEIQQLKEENATMQQVNKANMLAIMEVHKRINSLEGVDE